MKFNPRVVPDGLFAPDMVMREHWGGERDFAWDHDQYWPALVSMCDANRAAWRARWAALGGGVGVKEWEYKCGDSKPEAGEPVEKRPTSDGENGVPGEKE
jgi:hypothetical protein